MKKSTKILTIVLSTLVALTCVLIGVGSTVPRDDKTEAPTVVSTTKPQAAPPPTTESPEEVLKREILGKWTDSAEMSGYEFFSDGTVEMTYVNLTVPVLNIPVNGRAKGTYKLSGDKLTTRFSIYSATIEDTFTVSVKGEELSMTNLEELETATYRRAKKENETTSPTASASTLPSSSANYDDEIIGSWVSSDRETKYKFNEESEVSVILKNNAYQGIYMTEGGNITIQYMKGSKKVTERFSYNVSKNVLSLKGEKGETLFMREGTEPTPSESPSETPDSAELLGSWKDSANMSGFEFKPDGIVEITYVNLTVPVLNIPINGTYTGFYTQSGNKLTITSNIAGTSLKFNYTYSISGNTLTLTNTDEGNVSTYIKG